MEEQQLTQNERMVLSQDDESTIVSTDKMRGLANHIRTLLVANTVRIGAMQIDSSVFSDLSWSDRAKFIVEISREQKTLFPDNEQIDAKKNEINQTLQQFADYIDDAFYLNVVEGLQVGDAISKYAIDQVMGAYYEKINAKRITDDQVSAQLGQLDKRVTTLEDHQLLFKQILADHQTSLENLSANTNALNQEILKINNEIKPLIAGRREEKLINKLWKRIEAHPKLVMYFDTVRKALHQRFFRSHVIAAGAALAETHITSGLVQAGVSQIPIVGFLASTAVMLGLATSDMMKTQYRQEQAEQFVD